MIINNTWIADGPVVWLAPSAGRMPWAATALARCKGYDSNKEYPSMRLVPQDTDRVQNNWHCL